MKNQAIKALNMLKSLKPIKEPYKYPLRVRVSITFSRKSSSTSKEIGITFTFFSILIGSVSRSRFESSDGKLWVYQTFTTSFFIFIVWIQFRNI